MGLLLQAVDVAGPLRWRWLLTDEDSGKPLADHQVDLDPGSDEVTAFGDLYEYARQHAAPDRREADAARIVTDMGEWAGRVLLGEQVGAAIAGAAPVTVRVTAPDGALPVLAWPLELAHAGGGPLAARGDVTLVYDVGPPPGGPKPAGGGPLRILAVFSQPTRTSVLAIRRERYALSRLVRRIVARQRRQVELRVVQYGVTRERLAEIADSGDGWDVLHLSGHGTRGQFLLERLDGSPDYVSTDDLVRLLRPVRNRIKLAVVSACESAAESTAQALRLVGLTGQADQLEQENAPAGQVQPVTGIARALVTELDCAVVAMRYPVVDDFAIAFGDALYERLLGRSQPADVAVARAMAEAPSEPVSLATPGLFGVRAAGLTLTAPRGRPALNPAEVAMAHFPAEPERFVGRAAAMAAASSALAPDSGRSTVLLHGMSGAGKTACALELAYRHQDSFAAAFWQAPTRDDEFAGALENLAVALEAQLGGYGFTMTGHIGTAAALEAFLPRLRRVIEDSGVLLVLDNLETLLTPEGAWRDPRWEPLLAALTGHDGESRLILTSRVAPAGLGGLRVLTLPMHGLSLAEAVAMARELPNLRGLLHADAPLRAPVAGVDQDRDRVRRVLHVVQGHPKLLELADAAATDPTRLDAQLAAAEDASSGPALEAFFRDGASTLDPEQFLAALTGWTSTALAVLPPAARLMAEFVACLEDDDRQVVVIEATWSDLWRQLDRPGDPPGPGPLLDELTVAALIQPETTPGPAGMGEPAAVGYRMHPGVAAAARAAAAGIRDTADMVLAGFWNDVLSQAQEHQGGEDSGLIVRAGLAAVPYLLRRGYWDAARALLGNAIVRDRSPGVIAAALPALRRAAAATSAPADELVLARALTAVDPDEAGRLMRGALDRAAAGGDDRLASMIAGDLVDLLRDAGRLEQALEMAGRMAGYTRRAGLGPWTLLADQGRRLQVLARMGRHEQVLAETEDLRARMAGLPDPPGGQETAVPWNVRETFLDTGRTSAVALRRWQQALDLNAEVTASVRQRGAGAHELARTRFNDAGPLIRLGRLDEAGRLLAGCQQVFEDERDIAMLANVFSARASLEAARGRWQAAAQFERAALRLGYTRPEPSNLASSHNNLTIYLRAAGGDQAVRRAHRLAAALLFRLSGRTHYLAGTVRALANELVEGAAPGLPSTVGEVVTVAEQTEGVRLGDLLAALEPDPRVVEEALAEVLHAAAEPREGQDQADPESGER